MPDIKSQNKKYYIFSDVIKAFAMFFVVFYHSFRTATNPAFPSVFDYIEYFIYSFLGTGVPLFFMTNGFLLFQRKFDIKKHALKTAKVLAITVIWAVFTLAVLMLVRGDSFSLSGFVKDLISLKPGYINHLWFMEALFFLYVVFPFLKWLYDRYFMVFEIAAAAVAVYTLLIPTYCDIGELCGGLPMLGFFIKLPSVYFFFSIGYFMAGGIIYKKCDGKKIRGKRLAVLLCAALLMLLIHTALGAVKSMKSEFLFDNAWACYSSIFIFAALCILFASAYANNGCMNGYMKKMPSVVTNIIKNISSDSLAIYFIHPILIAIAMLLPGIEELCGIFILNLIFSGIIFSLSILAAEGIKQVPKINRIIKL